MLRVWRTTIAFALVPAFLGRAPVPVAPCWGDVNSDAQVDIADAHLIARLAIGMRVADSRAILARGDVTADGQVNVSDAQQIARHSVGLPAARRLSAACLG